MNNLSSNYMLTITKKAGSMVLSWNGDRSWGEDSWRKGPLGDSLGEDCWLKGAGDSRKRTLSHGEAAHSERGDAGW